MTKIYITGNTSDTLAKEIERQLTAYLYNAHADMCGDDNSSYTEVMENLKGYTDAVLLVDLDESCDSPTFAFKVGYMIGKMRRKNVCLYFLHASDRDIEKPLFDLQYYCIKNTGNVTDVAEEICYEMFERWREGRAQFKVENLKNENENEVEEIYLKALKYLVLTGQASVSAIMRQFPVGYIKACKIIDWMRNNNYSTMPSGDNPEKILLTYEEFKKIYGDIDD